METDSPLSLLSSEMVRLRRVGASLGGRERNMGGYTGHGRGVRDSFAPLTQAQQIVRVIQSTTARRRGKLDSLPVPEALITQEDPPVLLTLGTAGPNGGY
jgi:hypothetical protein